MKTRTVETSVGIFVLLGLLCVAYLTIKLGKMEVFGGKYYYINAKFGSVSGLKRGAPVDVAGVQVGTVESIALEPETMAAMVRLKIRLGVPLKDDSMASVKTIGLIGDKFIKIEPGGSNVLLNDGDTIIETESAVDLESVIGKYAFGDVSKK